MKISFLNIGCKLNFAEMSEIQKQFDEAGFEVVEFKDKADVVLINTCTVTNNADADSRKYIRKAIRNNPDAFIGVMGCYSQLKPDEVINIEGVDAVFGTNNKFDIKELIGKFEKKTKTEIFIPNLEAVPFHFASSVDNESRTRIVIKIQDGCDYVCTYCAVPYARGKSRSMDFSELENKFSELNKKDFYEVVLSGINLGEYKSQNGERFVDVVKLIANSDYKFRARISSVEPNLVSDEIISMVNDSERLCRHFHIPLQSGSQEILQLMKRRYKVSDFEKLVHKIKTVNEDFCIGVDVIVGFPGETDEHFQETYELIGSLPVSYLHVFTYSERDVTPASKYENKVPVAVRKERTKVLRELSESKRKEFYSSQIGKVQTLIPEKDYEQNGNLYEEGFTDNYVRVKYQVKSHSEEPKRVNIEGFDGKKMPGKLI